MAWGGLVETVLFQGVCGVYLIPPECPVHSNLRTVLFAWKDTVDAARAIRVSLPLLRKATRVCLFAVDTAENRDLPAQMSALAAHLDRHGVRVEITVVPGLNDRIGGVVHHQAARISADLIALGAFGHSRLRELFLGGVTRELIERSDVPLLFAH